VTEILERLAKLNVQSLSLTFPNDSQHEIYDDLHNQAASLGLALKFDLPVPYSEHNPIAFETLPDRNPPGAGNAWFYIEPDGDVLPAQGMAGNVLGNFLRDDWKTIHPAG
jgi:MoaA/NifB/PqqE/SkfB family radical SAM enzyme